MANQKKIFQLRFTARRFLKAEMCIYPLESYPAFPPGRTDELVDSIELVLAETEQEAMRLLSGRYEVLWIESCTDLGYRH